MTIPYIVKQKLFSQLLEQSEHGIFVLDDQFRYVFVNDDFAKLMNMTPDELVGRSISIFKEQSLSVEAKLLLDDILNNLILKNFHQSWVDLHVKRGKPLQATLKIYGMHVSGDIYYAGFLDENSKSGNDNAIESINYDVVTNLPFRQYFLIQFGDLILDTIDELVLVRLSFDRFRTLKTNYMPEVVDQMVAEFVQRIYDLNLHDLMLFSRFDEDEFAMVFEVNDAQMIRNELDKILMLAERPYFIGDDTVFLHFSAGVSQYPKNGNQVDILLDNAEKALHYVREKGGDDVFWYDDEINQVSAEKLQLETELRTAIAEEQFFPVYQPKVDLASHKIVGFEALVRWQHPKHGIKAPDYFLEGLLEHKLSFDLFCTMAEQVLKDLHSWQQHGFQHELCINADTYDFLHPQFTKFMDGLLRQYPVRRGSLHVEVTENSLMQQYDVDVLSQFKKLKDLGVQIALDDFGTGYASISYLRHYPFDYIKIDKSFVDDIEQVNTQILIVRAIIDLASALNLYTVAEGIESLSQAQVMYDMGCVIGQGYYFGRPVPYQDATDLIIASKEEAPTTKTEPSINPTPTKNPNTSTHNSKNSPSHTHTHTNKSP